MKKMKSILAFMLMAYAVFFQTGCKKDNPDAPKIPPSSSFVMNLTDLDSSKAGKMGKGLYDNYLFAAGNVFVWNVVLTVGLYVPVASFVNSFNYQGVWDNKEKAWFWKYDFTAAVKYSAKLKAQLNGNVVHWEMYISKENGFQDFMWYEGNSYVDDSQGDWTLYDNAISNKELLGIVWHKNSANGTSDIKYTNIIPGNVENGGYIEYGITTDTTYNAYYNIYNKGQNNHTNIKWNRTTKNGRVYDVKHFSDSLWHCWDIDYKNINCN